MGYAVRNLVLRPAIKRNFQAYIRQYTSPNETFEYGYPHSDAFMQLLLKLQHCKLHKAAHHPTKCGINNDVKPFPTANFCVVQSYVALQKQVH